MFIVIDMSPKAIYASGTDATGLHSLELPLVGVCIAKGYKLHVPYTDSITYLMMNRQRTCRAPEARQAEPRT